MHSLKVSGECGDVLCTHAAEEIERLQALAGAAPELLAALKVAADAIDYAQAQVDSENDRHNLLVRLVQVKRVIAKAEGGDA
jgi:hypothetical protein